MTTPDGRAAVLALASLLRRAGVEVATGQVLAGARATEHLAPLEAADLYWSGRATLISHPRDLDTYDRVFHALLDAERLEDGEAGVMATRETGVVGADRRRGGGGRDGEDAPEPDRAGAVASDVEVLRHRRFDRATPEELRAMRRLMERIELSVPTRRTPRRLPARRGRELDLGRSLRAAVRTDGELIRRAWRRRRRVPRALVLVLDVSGSMAGFSRALLQFAAAARRGTGEVEVFCFGTRLTRVTEQLRERDGGGGIDAALAAAAERVVDWDGGTLIGPALDELTSAYVRGGRLRGAVVVVCSDGLERGDPELLRRAAARLGRYAHRLIWVNPLSADPRFEPVQQGMRAALPAVDRLLAGHDLASLEELGAIVAALR